MDVVGVSLFHLINERWKVDNVEFVLIGTLFDNNLKDIATIKVFPNSNTANLQRPEL